jgi:hypothetical protein
MRWIVAVMTTLLLVASPIEAQASRPSTYCSVTGDICQSTTRGAHGVRMLRITLAAKYFDTYSICVAPPQKSPFNVNCKNHFKIRATGATFGSSIRWSRNFPNRGPGIYTVSWRTSGHLVGHVLAFRQS